MTGKELLEWLQAVPEKELQKTEVFIDTGLIHPLVTAKYHKGSKPRFGNKIFLVYK